jgi:ComF family protein
VQHPPAFDLARSYGVYGGPLRELIHLLKYQGMTPLAGPLGARMVEAARRAECAGAYAACDAVVAMPLDAIRRRDRGYNQAELLAREVARGLDRPLWTGACRRVRSTTPQAGLSRTQRRANVNGAFAAEPRRVADRTILLVDDVMTTGATLSACSRALFQAGARRILALTLAHTAEPFQNIPNDSVV